MLTPETLRLVPPAGLAYETWLAGKPIGRSELRLQGQSSLLVWTRTDLVAAGLGPAAVEDVTTVDLSAADGRPTRFARESGGRRIEVAIEGGQARAVLPDGSTQSVPVGVIDGVLDSNLPGLTALLVAALIRDGRAARILVGSQVLAMPYQLEPAGVRTWRSPFDEQIETDDAGLAQTILTREQSARTVQVEPRPFDMPVLSEAEPAIIQETLALRPRTFVVPAGDVQLHAICTAPDGPGPHPAALLIPGSGAVDRFGVAGGIDTGLRQIGNGLTRRGFAVTTVDKAGSGRTSAGSSPLERGFSETVDEAVAVLDVLARDSAVSGRGVGLVGHSLGGLVAIEAALRRPDLVGGIALMAVPGRTVDALIEGQMRTRAAALGLDAGSLDEQVADLRRFVELAREPDAWTEESVPARFYAASRARRWMQDLIAFDPGQRAAALRCPVFLAIGTEDVQVSQADDFDVLAAALPHAEQRIYQGVDHLFMPSTASNGLAAYARPGRRVLEQLCDDLAEFLRRV